MAWPIQEQRLFAVKCNASHEEFMVMLKYKALSLLRPPETALSILTELQKQHKTKNGH